MQENVMTRAGELLREYFGYDAFHPGQEKLIEQLLAGRDVLGVMPTGAGKSICYQLPALLLPGLTIVISPLISLMKDQVDGLCRMGVPAAMLNSAQSAGELSDTYRALEHGAVKLLYIAPERMDAEGFASYLAGLEVSHIAVDEAHCVSQWGHDFRPSYRRIRNLIDLFPTRPVVGAFTATATQRVRADILELLALQNPFALTTGFDRPNLYFAVHTPPDRDEFVLDYVRENRGAAGIIYCLTRKQVDKLAGILQASGIAALPYHAGLPDEERTANQEAFRNDTVEVIVATNAFGMGIDKSNVRFVIHYGMPKTLENYYQEAGRAGRDGERADCLLLYSGQDIVTNRFLIDHSTGQGEGGSDPVGEYRKLQDMVDYCNGDSCLRAYILRYFGVEDVPETCDNCLYCVSDNQQTDITIEAQKILSCVRRMGGRFGSALVSQVLRGRDNEKIRQMGFDKLSTYGIMQEYTAKALREIIAYLVAKGYLELRGGEYPVLYAGERALRFLKERETLTVKRAMNATARRRKRGTLSANEPLFDALRQLRREIATEQDVPPYIIFTDATLKDMCARLPQNREELRQASGVGRVKLEQYGDRFLAAIIRYREEQGIPGSIREEAPPAPPEKLSGGDSVMQSYALYRQGKTIEEIAAARGVATQTVENHLVKAHRAGEAVDLEAFIPAAYRDAIFRAINEQGADRLRPIKDVLPEEVSYTAIRFAVEVYRGGLS
jgi:ATP-dependent DNA helicase RecQ